MVLPSDRGMIWEFFFSFRSLCMNTYQAILLQWRVRRKKRDFRASNTTSAAHHVIVHICTIVYQWRAAGDLV